MDKMKVVILCGGLGTRLREETVFRPKPMVEVAGRPILWHIMKIYAYYGLKDFVLCLGYKGEVIKEYFYNYEFLNNNFTVTLGEQKSVEVYSKHAEDGWRISLIDTGKDAMTGARVKRIQKYIDSELFALTYGDGLSDIDIRALIKFHRTHGKIGTITGVNPQSRFGKLVVEEDRVVEFSEKPLEQDDLINGGFFIFNRAFFDYLDDDEGCVLEKSPMEKLSNDNELMVYRHDGFWQCMDTYRDAQLLNSLWNTPKPPWKKW